MSRQLKGARAAQLVLAQASSAAVVRAVGHANRANLLLPAAVLLALGAHIQLAEAAAPAPARVAVRPGAGLRLSADELAYRTGQLDLRGRVSIELGSLRLRAARLSVELDQQGRPRRLQASGGVELVVDEATGRAGQASLVVAEGALELSGAARIRLRGPSLELEGDRIELDLASGGLRVRRARATLAVPAAQSGGRHALR